MTHPDVYEVEDAMEEVRALTAAEHAVKQELKNWDQKNVRCANASWERDDHHR